MTEKKESLYLRYSFSEEEKKEIALKMAQGQREKKNLEDDKKSVMSDFKSRLDLVEGNLNRLATNYDAGYEMRNIECKIIYDFKKNTKKWVRTDNDEIVKEIPIPMEDKQTNLAEN